MIKIDMNAEKFKSGRIDVKGTVEFGGSGEVLEAEIYGILKHFETELSKPFGDALDRVVREAMEE